MSEIRISAFDGSGDFMAYIATPSGKERAPCVIVIQEIFGVNAYMRGLCDDLAKRGFIAVCPDLFWRQEPAIQLTDQSEEEWKRAFELFNGFDIDKGIDDLKATLQTLRTHEKSNGRVATQGYCLGGKLAYLMATRSDADCNVSYYGVGLDTLLDEKDNIQKPLLMHIAALDKFVPAAAREKIMDTLEPHPNVMLRLYDDVDHAFARVGGEHYNEDAATLANERTDKFLSEHLMS